MGQVTLINMVWWKQQVALQLEELGSIKTSFMRQHTLVISLSGMLL